MSNSNNYYFGRDQQELIGSGPRYFHALRRNADGEITLALVDQLSRNDSIQINNPGDVSGNFTAFEPGTDFYDNRDINHALVYANLNYEQYRWDDRRVYYYIDSDGELVARINTKYPYPTGISSNT
jgi:hypothetical protein